MTRRRGRSNITGAMVFVEDETLEKNQSSSAVERYRCLTLGNCNVPSTTLDRLRLQNTLARIEKVLFAIVTNTLLSVTTKRCND